MSHPEGSHSQGPTITPDSLTQVESLTPTTSDNPAAEQESLITEELRQEILEAQTESAVTLLGS